MIKAVGTTADGDNYLVLGISDENVKRLRGDKPILFETGQLLPAGTAFAAVLIFYKPTDHELVTSLQTAIGPDTIVHAIPRGTDKAI